MRIAFTSYEYPPETGGGGIGTYLQIVAPLLIDAGNSVVIFSGTKKTEAFWENEYVFRIPATSWKEFDQVLPNFFLPMYEAEQFDVLECTDFQACGLSVKLSLPNLPTVIRLHTPLYMVDRLLHKPLTFAQKTRFILGSLRKMKIAELPGPPERKNYQNEFHLVELADVVSSPSQSIYKEMLALGFDLKDKTQFVPLPFDTKAFSATEVKNDISNRPHIVFVGRLEYRKGVIDLAEAIPDVLKQFPDARFTFIGDAALSPKAGIDMRAFLENKLKGHARSVSFTGKLPRADVMKYFNDGDIFVFPSHYESFGLVCCEAMAAGKAVIGSANGGMAEIIENGKSGILIEPKKPELISKQICRLIADNEKRLELGKNARARIDQILSPTKIVGQQLAAYQKAIEIRKQKAAIADDAASLIEESTVLSQSTNPAL